MLLQDTPVTRANFAVLAAQRIAEGDAQSAVHLCAEGIASYPDYLGGYIVLAKAYDELQQHDDAYIMRTEAHRRFPWLPWVGPLADREPVTVPDVPDMPNADVKTVEPGSDRPLHDSADADVAEACAVAIDEASETVAEPTEQAQRPTLHVEAVAGPVEDVEVVVVASNEHEPGSAEHTAEAIRQHEERAEHVATSHTLRLIQTAAPVDDKRIIRSAAVRLIPGLEFTSLRFEGVKQRGRRTSQRLQDPPPFREFHAPVRRRTPMVAPPTTTEQPTRKRPFSLEELAQRLERARLPRPDAAPAAVRPSADPKPAVEASKAAAPVVFSETMARIYEAQGSFDLAIEVYRALQQQQPDRSEYFQSLVDAITAKRGA